MLKKLATFALLGFSAATASGQGLEPGEWQFDSTTAAALLPKPQSATFTRCVRKEDAENPERWLGRQSEKNGCDFTVGEKTANSMKWQVSCPKTNMRGSGSARIGQGTMEGEMRMTGNVRGRSFETNTHLTGRRIGPCKS